MEILIEFCLTRFYFPIHKDTSKDIYPSLSTYDKFMLSVQIGDIVYMEPEVSRNNPFAGSIHIEKDSSANKDYYAPKGFKNISFSALEKMLKEIKQHQKELIVSELEKIKGKLVYTKSRNNSELNFFFIESVSENTFSGNYLQLSIKEMEEEIFSSKKDERVKIPFIFEEAEKYGEIKEAKFALKFFQYYFIYSEKEPEFISNSNVFEFSEKVFNKNLGVLHNYKIANATSIEEILEFVETEKKKLGSLPPALTVLDEINLGQKFVDRRLTEQELRLLRSKRDEIFSKIDNKNYYGRPAEFLSKILFILIPDSSALYEVPLDQMSFSSIEKNLLDTFEIMFNDFKENYKKDYQAFPVDIIRLMFELLTVFYTIKKDFINLTLINNFKANFDWNEINALIRLLENKLLIMIDEIKCCLHQLYIDSSAYKKMRTEEMLEAVNSGDDIIYRMASAKAYIPFNLKDGHRGYGAEKEYRGANKVLADSYDNQIMRMYSVQDSILSDIENERFGAGDGCSIKRTAPLVLKGEDIHSKELCLQDSQYQETSLKSELINIVNNSNESDLSVLVSFFKSLKV